MKIYRIEWMKKRLALRIWFNNHIDDMADLEADIQVTMRDRTIDQSYHALSAQSEEYDGGRHRFATNEERSQHEITNDGSSTDIGKILCIGRICLDIVYTCTHYPSEDSTQRSVDYRCQRRGNASNTCIVLSLLNLANF